MSFRARLVGAVTAMTLLTLGGAFATVYVAVNRAQERRLDGALLRAAAEEARAVAALPRHALEISDRPGPAADEVVPLTKYGAVYDRDGRVLVATPTFRRPPPPLGALLGRAQAPFDLWHRGEHLRGVLVPVPDRPRIVLLLAVPRADLDSDAAFLKRAMALVFVAAVAWSTAVASWIVRRLIRHHQAIARVARQVAAGDLSARVAVRSADREVAQLARDVNEMIERLGLLVESQQRFIAHAAHELRSPLTTLYGELSHALRRSRDAQAYRTAIEEALESTRSLKLLADDLLALARLGAGREEAAEPVELAAVVDASVAVTAREAAERGVAVRVHGRAPVVLGHGRDLERMLRNLLENAVRHTPRGGAVRVACGRRGADAEVVVCDEGPGVPVGERERIFEPFYRGGRERAGSTPGAGLGLSIAREIARAHGGELRLETGGDTAPPGARFVVTLPAADGAPAAEAAEVSAPAPAAEAGAD